MNTNTPTTGSKPESHRQKITRFEDAIRKKFKCSAEYKRDHPCDFSPSPSSYASVFKFSGAPAKFPEAKQCFVWDSSGFKPGSTGTIVVADVEVLDDSERLPFFAVFAWLTKSLVTDADRDIYVSSDRENLHRNTVDFRLPTGERETGFFFIRKSNEGNISVRICQEHTESFDNRSELVDRSFCRLTGVQIKKIEELPGENCFTMDLW